MNPIDAYSWNETDRNDAHQKLMAYVEAVERENSNIFDRFVKLAWLYDPNRRNADPFEEDRRVGKTARVQENVIASNCDSITGVIASKEVRARFMTDGAEWSVQRRARACELYAEEIGKLLRFDELATRAFFDAALKGTGLATVTVDRFGKLIAERVMVDEIVVDPQECNGGEPYQMARRRMISKARLMRMYPSHAKEIREAQGGQGKASWRYWADYRPINRDELVLIEAWYLPIGQEGEEGYQVGRYVVCIDGVTLEDEDYEKDHFPFAVIKWTESPDGWYGIGGAQRIAGHQRAINKTNWQIDRQIDQYAVPTTWVHISDQNIQCKTVNEFGTMGAYRVREPKTVFPPSVSPETYKRREDTLQSAYNEFGQSRMAATAMKPSGLDSGAALREYKDQTTDRFAVQEKAYERFRLDLVWLAMDACKDMAAAGLEPPVVTRAARTGRRKIRWSEVDLGEVRVQLAPASTLARTPAGRTQAVMEFAQAGIISQDEARRLIQHPDLERALSLYTAALEYVEHSLEAILDGEVVIPVAEMNLKMCVWRGEAQYQLADMDGAPESVLENLHNFITLASYELDLASQAVANQNAAMMAAMAPPLPGAGAPAPAGQMPMGPVPGAPAGDPLQGAGVFPLQMAG